MKSVRARRPLLRRIFGGDPAPAEIGEFQSEMLRKAIDVSIIASRSGFDSSVANETIGNYLTAAYGGPVGFGSKRSTDPFPFIGYSRRFPSRNYRLPKLTPVNLRTFAESPVVRHAINKIKNEIRRFRWDVVPRPGIEWTPGLKAQAETVRNMLERPNNDEAPNWGTFHDMIVEDMLCFGGAFAEFKRVGDAKRPARLWPVASESMQINPNWLGDPNVPRFAQVIGYAFGIAVATGQNSYQKDFFDGQMVYFRYNPRTTTPFGLGPVEAAFNMINFFLSANDQAGRFAANEVASYLIDLGRLSAPEEVERMVHYWQDEIEGQGRVPILGGFGSTANQHEGPESALKVHPLPQSGDPMRLEWQNFLIRVIGMAFQLSAMKMNLERDVNRSTAEVLDDTDFTSAIQPVADTFADTLTVDLIQRKLGFHDLEFRFNYPQNEEKISRILANYASFAPVAVQLGIFSKASLREQIGRNFASFDSQLEDQRIKDESVSPGLDFAPPMPAVEPEQTAEENPVTPTLSAPALVSENPSEADIGDLSRRVAMIRVDLPAPYETDGRRVVTENEQLTDDHKQDNPNDARNPKQVLQESRGFVIPEDQDPARMELFLPDQLSESQKRKLRDYEREWKLSGEPNRRKLIGKWRGKRSVIRGLRSVGVENPWAVAAWIDSQKRSFRAATGAGTIIALWVPSDIADRIAVPGGEDPADLHITLIHLGNAESYDNVKLARLREICSRTAAAHTGPVEARVSGVGVFDGVGQDSRDCFHATLDVPAASAIRQTLMDSVAAAGFQPSVEYGFDPHVTLAYIDDDEPLPMRKIENAEFGFSGLTLAYGGAREIFPFGH